MLRSGRTVHFLLAALIGASACTADTSVTQGTSRGGSDTATRTSEPTSETPTTTTASQGSQPDDGFVPDPLDWEEYDDGVESAVLTVPIDYDDPDGPTLDLFVVRHLADGDDRIGSLLVNPGGPGFGGTQLALFAESIYSPDLVDSFDIVGWDPRGTGTSEPAIDCVSDYDRYFATDDITPDTPAEHDARVDTAEDFAEACEQSNPEIIEHVGTNNSARDMDTLRRALGEDTISYFGFSYGSELGATWATLFPDTVRAAVLDGASDPTADSDESSRQQIEGFEASLATFLAQCSADSDCAFHNGGSAEEAFDELMRTLDENPVPSEAGRPDVSRGVALNGVVQAMYDDRSWPTLAQALADAAAGDGSGLLALHDQYYQRGFDGSYGNELEAFQVITCADTAERPTVAEEDAAAPSFTEAAPRLAPEGSTGGYFCTFFPPALDPRIEITGEDAGPIVVIGTTGDPATPLESTRAMAEALEDGRFVIVEADQHTGYNVNLCINELVDDYLIDLEPPADGTECT